MASSSRNSKAVAFCFFRNAAFWAGARFRRVRFDRKTNAFFGHRQSLDDPGGGARVDRKAAVPVQDTAGLVDLDGVLHALARNAVTCELTGCQLG